MSTIDASEASQEAWQQFYRYAKEGCRDELVTVHIHGFRSPIYLRRSTSDIDNFIQIYLSKEYDFLPNTPATILDLGGYVGLASTYLANKFPKSRIVLVEPDPDNYTIARLNCRQFPNIDCLNMAVWTKKCELTIADKVNGDWGTMLRETKRSKWESPTIKAFSIPEIMNQCNLKTIDFLKIDVEGTEKILFSDKKASSWIKKTNTISCELHDRMVPGCSAAFHSAMHNLGFTHGRKGEFDYYFKGESYNHTNQSGLFEAANRLRTTASRFKSGLLKQHQEQ